MEESGTTSQDFEAQPRETETNSRNMAFDINTLPDEAILHIFSFLPPQDLVNLQDVCSRWSKLSLTKSLWRKVRIAFDHGSTAEDGNLSRRLWEIAPVLGGLGLHFKSRDKCEEAIEQVFSRRHLEELRELLLGGPFWNACGSLKLLHNFSHCLEVLRISHCISPENVEEKKNIMRAIANLSELRELEIDHSLCLNINIQFCAFSHLKLLHLLGSDEISSFEDLLKRYPLLSKMRNTLQNFGVRDLSGHLNNDVEMFVSYFHKLEVLIIYLSINNGIGACLGWAFMKVRLCHVVLPQHCNNSRELRHALENNTGNFSTVRELYIHFFSGVENSLAFDILQKFPNLERLTLAENNVVSRNHSFEFVAKREIITSNAVSTVFSHRSLNVEYVVGCDCGCMDGASCRDLINAFPKVTVIYKKQPECVCQRKFMKTEKCAKSRAEWGGYVGLLPSHRASPLSLITRPIRSFFSFLLRK